MAASTTASPVVGALGTSRSRHHVVCRVVGSPSTDPRRPCRMRCRRCRRCRARHRADRGTAWLPPASCVVPRGSRYLSSALAGRSPRACRQRPVEQPHPRRGAGRCRQRRGPRCRDARAARRDRLAPPRWGGRHPARGRRRPSSTACRRRRAPPRAAESQRDGIRLQELGERRDDVRRGAGPVASRSLGRSTPVSTQAESSPAARAPAMSVSRRSPTARVRSFAEPSARPRGRRAATRACPRQPPVTGRSPCAAGRRRRRCPEPCPTPAAGSCRRWSPPRSAPSAMARAATSKSATVSWRPSPWSTAATPCSGEISVGDTGRSPSRVQRPGHPFAAEREHRCVRRHPPARRSPLRLRRSSRRRRRGRAHRGAAGDRPRRPARERRCWSHRARGRRGSSCPARSVGAPGTASSPR